jgi:hypothetical protein
MKFHIAQLLDLFSFHQLCRLSGNLEMRERLMGLLNSEWLLTMQSRDLVARSTVGHSVCSSSHEHPLSGIRQLVASEWLQAFKTIACKLPLSASITLHLSHTLCYTLRTLPTSLKNPLLHFKHICCSNFKELMVMIFPAFYHSHFWIPFSRHSQRC